MASRRRSAVWERKGSMEREREGREGESGEGVDVRVLRVGVVIGGVGMVCRYEVRRWELWIVRGSSWRMSW